jgi:hypothetical protein
MYYIPEPPYLLVVFGLLASLASGAAFEAALKEKVKKLSTNLDLPNITLRKQLDIFVPFLGICAGTSLFLAAGLGLFNVNLGVGYVISLVLTALVAKLIWSQLIKLLIQLQEGGSQALDLDSY